MKNKRILRLLAFVMAMIVGVMSLGCTASDVGDALEIAGDVLELVDELNASPETTEQAADTSQKNETTQAKETTAELDENGEYSSKADVALYIHIYGKLPKNFITKSEAEKLGWEGGSVEVYAPGCAIGGDKFGNREGLLPSKKGRTYTECDIDTIGKSSRGAKRIVFSNDGLVYYTDDHYESFELLYGEEE